jgi:hypothetical protein
MIKSSLFSLFSSAALALALVGHASATTITIGGHTVTGQGQFSSVPGMTTTTFDGLTSLPVGFTSMNTTPSDPVVQGSVTNVYKAPTGDYSTYLTTGLGTITDTLSKPSSYFGFYWGSLDYYNNFTLLESNGSSFTINGAQLATNYGLQDNGANSYYVNFFAGPGVTFDSASFASNGFAFEIDNIATACDPDPTAAPEPASVATSLGGGLLILAGAIRRRKGVVRSA